MASLGGKATGHHSCHNLRNGKCEKFDATSECRFTANRLKIEWKIIKFLMPRSGASSSDYWV